MTERQDVPARTGLPAASAILAVAAAVAVLPHLVVLARALGTDWHPSGDQAMEIIRMHDVGTSRTPLLGPYSRFGWDHPGPLLFWIGAPGLRLAGPVGVLVTVGLLNVAATVGVVAAARRLAGDAFALAVATATAVMVHSHGAVKLVDPWNPWVTVLPLLCYLLCIPVAVIHRSRWAVVTAVATGSFVAQSHLGNVPVVVAAAGAGVVSWLHSRRSPDGAGPADGGRSSGAPGWRALLLPVGLLALLWSGPLVDQLLRSPGNLWSLAEFALDSPERPPPLGQSLGVAARELGFPPAWAGAREGTWPVDPAPSWTLLLLPAALVAGVLAGGGRVAGRGRGALAGSRPGDHLRLVAYVLVVYAAAAFAVTRTTGGLIPYVLRWTWPVAVLASVVALLPLLAKLEGSSHPTRRTLGGVGAGLAATVLVAASIAAVVDGARTPVEPSPTTDRSVGGLADAIREGLPPGTYGLQWLDVRSFSAVSIGVGVDLVRRGYEIDFPADHAPRVGGFRATGRTDVPLLLIVGQTPLETWVPPDGARRVATWDHLTRAERERADRLEDRVRRDASLPAAALVAVDTSEARDRLVADGAQRDDVDELHALEADREGYEAWLAPAGTSRPRPPGP